MLEHVTLPPEAMVVQDDSLACSRPSHSVVLGLLQVYTLEDVELCTAHDTMRSTVKTTLRTTRFHLLTGLRPER